MAKKIKSGSKKKRRGYRGGPPGSKWPRAKIIDEIECVVEGLDTNYQLWLLQAPSPSGWLSLKLTSLQRRRKANYWFGWSLSTNRSNSARDLEKTMKMYDPALRKLVVQSLKRYVEEQQQQ
jgi:hypothetical protein